MKIKIDLKDISYPSGNAVDPFGRVFFKGEKVFRAISKEYENLCNELLKSDLLEELTDKQLVPKTLATNYEVDDCRLILEHEKVTYTQPSEWTFEMLKDAGIAILEINGICKKYGFCLKDAHPWNIAFKNNHPIFLDFGSIARVDSCLEESFNQEYKNTILYPLLLWSNKEDLIAQALLSNPANMYKFTIPRSTISSSLLINSLLNSLDKKPDVSVLYLKGVSLDRIENTEWKEYQNEFFSDFKKGALCSRFQRFQKITDLLSRFSSDAETVLDLAGNMGAVAYYLEKEKKYKRIINVDYDENAVDVSYKRFRELGSKTETYLLNFMLPKNREVFKNFKSDIVLGLAVTHHLILSQNFDLEFIFDRMASFSKKYVYVEFMPLGLWGGGDLPAVPEWYTQEWFKQIFKRKFNFLHCEHLERNRVLFVGTIKR